VRSPPKVATYLKPSQASQANIKAPRSWPSAARRWRRTGENRSRKNSILISCRRRTERNNPVTASQGTRLIDLLGPHERIVQEVARERVDEHDAKDAAEQPDAEKLGCAIYAPVDER
jgi:hypothetical protein